MSTSRPRPQRGIVVMNTPFGNSITTAEHAIAMMFALARQLPAADRSTQAGKWEKNRFMGVELSGKTLGIIGCGNIGSIVADRALGLKMKVIAFDPFLSPERAASSASRRSSWTSCSRRADFITLHTPLTDATAQHPRRRGAGQDQEGRAHHQLRARRPDRRGGAEGGARHAARSPARRSTSSRSSRPRTTCCSAATTSSRTPHLGASTTEAQENVALQVAEQMSDFLLTGAVTNALNMPSVSAEEAPRLKPYMQAGRAARQLRRPAHRARASRAIEIEYEGHAAELNTKPLTAIALTALLSPQLDTRQHGQRAGRSPASATSRSARRAARARADYHTLIRVTVDHRPPEPQHRRHAVRRRQAAHRRRSRTSPSKPSSAPHMLYVRNQDKPGFIGHLGRSLGEAGINIATFHLGRTARAPTPSA